jgi:hypothetical protein
MEYLHRTFDSLYKWNSQRLKRIEYFSYSILGSIVTLALLALISPILDLEGSIWVVISLGLLVLAVVHNCYVSINLVRKRLSDMGWDSVHLWWIFGLWFVTSIHSYGEPDSTVTYSLLGLDIVVSLWILFSPSKSK